MWKKISLVGLLAVLLISAGNCFAQTIDFSNDGLVKAAKESARFVAETKPPEPRVLEPSTYFLDHFNAPRKVGAKTFRLSGTDLKLIVCNELSKAMLDVVKQFGDEAPTTLQLEWFKREQQTLNALATVNADGEAALSQNEAAIWNQFFEQWRADVSKTDPARLKDALLQAAYELVKAGLDIQTAQETTAKSAAAGPARQGSGAATRSNGGGGGGYYPQHERAMNRIYRHHQRRMNSVERIRARR